MMFLECSLLEAGKGGKKEEDLLMYDDDVSHFQRVKFMLWYKKMNKLSYQSLFIFLITCKTVDLCLRLGWETKKNKNKTVLRAAILWFSYDVVVA